MQQEALRGDGRSGSSMAGSKKSESSGRCRNPKALLTVLWRMNGDRFEYWIGMLFPTNTAAPDGYQYEDLAEGDVGVCWLYGNADNGELYGMDPHNVCMAKIAEQGWQQRANAWFFERYHHPRFTTPDEKGNVVLDYGVYVK